MNVRFSPCTGRGADFDRDVFEMAHRTGAFIRHQDADTLEQCVVIPEALHIFGAAQRLEGQFPIHLPVFGEIVVEAQQRLLFGVLQFEDFHSGLLNGNRTGLPLHDHRLLLMMRDEIADERISQALIVGHRQFDGGVMRARLKDDV